MRNSRTVQAVVLATVLPFAMSAHADNARDWQNLPKDLNMVFGYYSSLDINTGIDTALAANDLSLDADLYIFRYVRSFAIDGRNSAVQIIQPYADVEASFDNARFFNGTQKNGGMGDTQLVFAHNIFGGPALTAEAFAGWTPETFVSGAFWLTVPNGDYDYDDDQVINIGANRWVFKPEIAFGHHRQENTSLGTRLGFMLSPKIGGLYGHSFRAKWLA